MSVMYKLIPLSPKIVFPKIEIISTISPAINWRRSTLPNIFHHRPLTNEIDSFIASIPEIFFKIVIGIENRRYTLIPVIIIIELSIMLILAINPDVDNVSPINNGSCIKYAIPVNNNPNPVMRVIDIAISPIAIRMLVPRTGMNLSRMYL